MQHCALSCLCSLHAQRAAGGVQTLSALSPDHLHEMRTTGHGRNVVASGGYSMRAAHDGGLFNAPLECQGC